MFCLQNSACPIVKYVSDARRRSALYLAQRWATVKQNCDVNMRVLQLETNLEYISAGIIKYFVALISNVTED
jgi:hypothetical protein